MARRQVRTNAVPLYQDFVSIRSDSRCRNCFSSILNGFPFFSALASRNALRCDVSWKSFSDGQPFFVAQFSFLRHILFIAKKKKKCCIKLRSFILMSFLRQLQYTRQRSRNSVEQSTISETVTLNFAYVSIVVSSNPIHFAN